jgi:hypothetical protein
MDQNEQFDVLHVRLHAEARDTDVPASLSDDEARKAAQAAPVTRFIEVWTFARRLSVKTAEDPSGSQGTCPNCGAPFSGGASNQCEFCSSIVNSGSYDWVLIEITQGSEFSPRHAVEGVPTLRRDDPAFANEILEDRASLLFWKWIEAQVLRDESILAQVAAPRFVEELGRELSTLKSEGRQRVFVECAVGAVNLRRVESGDEADFASVEIRWSARVAVQAEGSGPGTPVSRPQRSVAVLTRKAGAKTQETHGLSTNRCPRCHAPLSDNGSTRCEFCSAELASGDADWVLDEWLSWETYCARFGEVRTRQATSPLERVPDEEERTRLLYLMAAMVAADKTIAPSELKALKLAAERWRVPWANVELALAAGPNLFDKLLASGSAEGETFLRELLTIALVDGRIDAKERRLLEAAAARVGHASKLAELIREASAR